ncbi:MAG: tetratricopeptide repeat protein [candidate division Zixibacteria bacterium]|nr:tetratricopeptide repeat protein [candidate division Zixibacteria bacterium]
MLLTVSGCYNPSLNKAKVYLKEGNLNEAKASLENYLDTYQTDAEALFLLGKVNAGLRDYDAMNHNFRRSLECSEEFSRRIEYVKRDSWALNYNSTMNSFESGNWNWAIKDGELCLVICDSTYIGFFAPPPQNIYEIKSILAESYYKIGLFDKSETYYKVCQLLKPDDLQILNRLAEIYYISSRYSQAIECYNHILSIAPLNESAAAYKAICVYQIFDRKTAINTLLELLEKTPGSQSLIKHLVKLYLEDKNYEAARQWLLKGGILDKNAEYYFALGECNYYLMDFSYAAVNFEKAVKLKPSDIAGWEYLKIIYSSLNEIDKRDQVIKMLSEQASGSNGFK